jgi:Kef-type K+ transport system membrane component KefB
MDVTLLTATLAAVDPDLERDVISLFIIALAAALVPLVIGLLRIPIAEVVVLLAAGILLGPSVLGWIKVDETVDVFNELGLGLLFFLAGYELENESIRGKGGRLAAGGWLTSLLLAVVVTWGLYEAGVVDDLVGVAICLTTTALGTLLPLIRDRGELGTPFGKSFMGAGAAGEFGPILAVSLLLGSTSLTITLLALLFFALTVWLVYRTPGRLGTGRVRELLERGHHTSSQTAVRWTVVLLLLLLVVAVFFGFDAVLGAFLGGVILRRYSPPDEANRLIPKIEALGFGFFIPLFFIVSGANLDIASIAEYPLRLVAFFVLLLLVRGIPQYILYRSVLPDRAQRWQFTLYVATGLPLIVAITSLQVDNGIMLPENAAALVGAGVLSVLVFPFIGDRIGRRAATERESVSATDVPD